MKNLKFRIGCLFMAFTVLLSSTGYGVFEHTCNFTQKKTISFQHEDECCDNGDTSDTAPTFKKASCCTLTQALNKVSVIQVSIYSPSLDFALDTLTYPVPHFASLLSLYEPEVLTANLANAPPLSTKLFLALYQTYLI